MASAVLPTFVADAPPRRLLPRRRRAVGKGLETVLGTPPLSKAPEELLRLVGGQRDRSAFGALYRMFGPKVRAYAVRMGASGASADDLVQDVMMSVWRKADSYAPDKANAATWVYAIARNRLLDEFRRTPPTSVQPEAVDEEPADDPAHEGRIDTERAAQRVRAAIDGLPAEQSEILRIAYYEGISQREIAARLGLPLGTVKSRTRLALDRLRSALDSEA